MTKSLLMTCCVMWLLIGVATSVNISMSDTEALAHISCPDEEGKILLLRPHPTNCRMMIACDDEGKPMALYCPKELVFSAADQDCRKKKCEKVTDPIPAFSSCPLVNGEDLILLPHPTDCEMFYICDHGFAHLRECPSKLHFNPHKKVCDWPHSASCKARFFMLKP